MPIPSIVWLAALLASSVSSTVLAADGTVNVRQPTLTAKIYYPTGSTKRVPGILVLGGAEGGSAWAESTAKMLADHGYVAMAEAYFKAGGLPDQLQRIPLERFQSGIDRLESDPRVDRHRIAIVGLSKGAEASLILASLDHRIKAVVAGSPSDVVWQGIDRKTGSVASSWTYAGRPLPFMSFVSCADCKTLASLYTASRNAPGANTAAPISVETIHAPILMLASEHDAVWPSEAMTDAIVQRLETHHFRYRVSTLRYPDGGHFTLGPIAPEDAETDASFGGGTPVGIVRARTDSWPHVLSFLDGALRYNARSSRPTP